MDAISNKALGMTALRRDVLAFVVGAVGGIAISFVASWQIAVTSGWSIAGLIVLLLVWPNIHAFDARETEAHATKEDDSRVAAGLLLLAAAVASLGATAFDLLKASQASGFNRFILTATAVVTITVSWVVVHTVFTLRYAHEYYLPPVGGIDFKTKQEMPNYRDFAYVAFTVGMTFQVSDTDIQRAEVRRSVLAQALISYLFGAVILAVTINVVASLFQ